MNFANPDYTDTYSYILVHTCTYSYILVHTVIQCHLIRISLELSCYDVNNRTFSPGLVLFLRCFYGIYCDKLACTCYISSYTRIYQGILLYPSIYSYILGYTRIRAYTTLSKYILVYHDTRTYSYVLRISYLTQGLMQGLTQGLSSQDLQFSVM